MKMKRIYLDHNATTPVHPDVLASMLPYLRDTFGNASSLHTFGQEAARALDEAREQVARLTGAEAREIVFTSGGTESDNAAIRGALAARPEKRHIVTTEIEHHAVLHTCKGLSRQGAEVTVVPVDEHGRVDPAAVAEAVRDDTAIVSVMFANNEVGTLQPVAEIARALSGRDVLFHTDAVQALGKVPMQLGTLGVDLASFSSHKIHGPKGVGALYVARGTRLGPLLTGGHHERGFRAGTENIPGIVGFGRACEIARSDLDGVIPKVRNLRDHLEEGIRRGVEDVRLNGHPDLRLPNTLNLSFAYVEGEALLLNLDLRGISVSTGSACTSGDLRPSHVLTAMGRTPEEAHGSLRFSLGRDNTEEEMDRTVRAVTEVVEKVRAMSPLAKRKPDA
jgi:cysteine desulfurase